MALDVALTAGTDRGRSSPGPQDKNAVFAIPPTTRSYAALSMRGSIINPAVVFPCAAG